MTVEMREMIWTETAFYLILTILNNICLHVSVHARGTCWPINVSMTGSGSLGYEVLG